MTNSIENPNIPVDKSDKTSDRPNMFKKIGKAAVPLLLAGSIVLMGGCGKNIESDNDPGDLDIDDHSTDYTITEIYEGNQVTPEGWFTDNKINYYDGTENTAQGFNFEKLNAEQQATIKRYESMSTEEFFNLPQEEQLTYSYWIFENNKPSVDLMFKFNDDERHYTFEPKTADDLFQNTLYVKGCFISLSKREDDGSGNMTYTYDIDNARKLLSMCYIDDGKNLESVSETLATLGRTSDMPLEGIVNGYKYYPNGEVYMNISERIVGQADYTEAQYAYSPKTFIDIHGNEKTIYLIKAGVDLNNPNYNNDVPVGNDPTIKILP